MLFAVSADSSRFATVEAEVKLDLDYRSELFDEWMSAISNGMGTSPRDAQQPSTAAQLNRRPSDFQELE
jgi:hypothetical protein